MDVKNISPNTADVTPLDLEGPGKPGKKPPVAIPVYTAQDARGTSQPQGPQPCFLPAPAPLQAADMASAAAMLDELMILFHQMSSEAQKVNQMSSYHQMLLARDQNLIAADMKQEAAATMRVFAGISIGFAVTSAVLSVAGAALSAVGSGAMAAAGEGIKMGKRILLEVIKAAFNPQLVAAVVDGVGKGIAGFGQADNQESLAESDRMNAQAQTTMSEKQRSDQFVETFRALMQKMNQLINDLLQAKNQSEAAAARA